MNEPQSNSEYADKALVCSGAALILLGVAHVPIYLASGASWEGPVSFRKPILFGISTGMTLWSLGWLTRNLNEFKLDGLVAKVVSGSLVFEVALIAMQFWRGQASHFNRTTMFDGSVDMAMLGMICVAFLGIGYLAVRSFGQLNLDADDRLAVRLGMLFLVVSCVIGFVISVVGYSQSTMGMRPETIGERGAAKFPHGIAIHALQFLPALVYILKKLSFALSQRLMMLWAASASMMLMLIYASYQTWSGLGRFELDSGTGAALLGSAAIAFVGPAVFVCYVKVRSVRATERSVRRDRPPLYRL